MGFTIYSDNNTPSFFDLNRKKTSIICYFLHIILKEFTAHDIINTKCLLYTYFYCAACGDAELYPENRKFNIEC